MINRPSKYSYNTQHGLLRTTGRFRTREDPAEQNSAPEDGRGADRVRSSSTWDRTTTGIRSSPGLEGLEDGKRNLA